MFTSGLLLIGFFDFGEKSPASAGKLVLVGQKTFCPTRTQLALFAWTENPHKFGLSRSVYTKRGFFWSNFVSTSAFKKYNHLLFCQYPDIWWHLMTSDVTKAGFGGICHTFATGYKNGVMPGHRNIPMSALRQFLLLTFHHDVMSICQEENGRSYCKYESFSWQAPEMSGPRENGTVPADSLPAFFRHGFGPAGRECFRDDMTVSWYGKPSVQGAGVIKKGRDNKTIINQSFGSLWANDVSLSPWAVRKAALASPPWRCFLPVIFIT